MDRWLHSISRQGVQQMYLHFGHHEYILPDCIFSCSTLSRLHLLWLCVTPNGSFTPSSLPNVTSFHFEHVDFGSRKYSFHPVDVPRLENLSFIACEYIFNCDITLKNLRSLKIKGCFTSLSSQQLCDFSAFIFDVTSVCYLELDNVSCLYVL
ncbi:hypothetical protein DM860_002283 [Cuscuta australis]|uniref:F-box/LRR-repeat protein 15/At3g58940/PEG3-like LRR domain-containing protein n=1 Tax=Cuscuta australis TaxID=267555 RepID=A0A328CXW0_9ASTE|nr:hypothetical protein DM860_002283 [Cuscuta australis]